MVLEFIWFKQLLLPVMRVVTWMTLAVIRAITRVVFVHEYFFGFGFVLKILYGCYLLLTF